VGDQCKMKAGVREGALPCRNKHRTPHTARANGQQGRRGAGTQKCRDLNYATHGIWEVHNVVAASTLGNCIDARECSFIPTRGNISCTYKRQSRQACSGYVFPRPTSRLPLWSIFPISCTHPLVGNHLFRSMPDHNECNP